MNELLTIEGLGVRVRSDGKSIAVLDGFSLRVARGGSVGLVGESGSGKSTALLAILRLLPGSAAVDARLLEFEGQALLDLGPRELLRVRGKRIGAVFQDPAAALNPYLTIDRQLTEVRKVHFGEPRELARAKALEALAEVGLDAGEALLCRHPHELSGGQRQRVAIAMATLGDPALLLADEPTTALDAARARQVLSLLARLRERRGLALVVASHDLGVVAGLCDRVAVVYAGRVVEEGAVGDVFARPAHPYTRALLDAVPRLDGPKPARLRAIPGSPPPPGLTSEGCAFAPRCAEALARCHAEAPAETRVGSGSTERRFRCFAPLS